MSNLIISETINQLLETIKFSVSNEQLMEIEDILTNLYETGVEVGKDNDPWSDRLE